MGKIYIICPECHQKLSFEEVPGYQNMLVECPKCHFKANASVYQSHSRGGQGASDTPTTLLYAPRSSMDIGQIRVISTNEIQYLKEGTQIIGRRANSGNADIKISDDIYMSRRHIRIDVVKKNGGYEHRLYEIGSTNLPRLNKNLVNKGDILIIHFGDIITLGKTDIRLESNSNDETKIFEE